TYLYARSMAAIVPIVVAIGFANGIFGFAQTTRIQRLDDERARVGGFLLVRLVSNIGLLLSTLLVVGAPTLSISLTRVGWVGIGATVFMATAALTTWLVTIRLRRGEHGAPHDRDVRRVVAVAALGTLLVG